MAFNTLLCHFEAFGYQLRTSLAIIGRQHPQPASCHQPGSREIFSRPGVVSDSAVMQTGPLLHVLLLSVLLPCLVISSPVSPPRGILEDVLKKRLSQYVNDLTGKSLTMLMLSEKL